VAATAAPGKPGAEPDSVTLAVTRPWGPLSGADQSGTTGTLWLRDVMESDLPRTSLLGSDQGRRARATLSTDAKPRLVPPTGLSAAKVTLDDEPRPGSYSGAIPLGTDGAVKVKVLVQDFILWPIAVVLVGALVGALGTKWYAWRRRRTMLLSSLKEALERYSDERAAAPTLGGAYDLEWPRPDSLPAAKACKGKADDIVDPPRQVEKVWCAVITANGADALERVTPYVAKVRAALDRWLELDFELRRLAAVASEVADHGLLPYEDSEFLAREMATPPASEDARTAGILHIRQHANILAAFVAAYAAWNALDGKQWAEHPELDPRTIYSDAPREADRAETDTAKLMRELGAARDKLRALEAGADARAEEQGARALGLPLLPSSAAAVSALAAALSGLGVRQRIEQQTAAELSARGRRWDGLLQGATAVVSVLAYVLTVYGGHTYGQPTDYLSAIAVGLLGQLGSFSINWDAFRGKTVTTPAAASGAATEAA
jgi:hypothetical protein